MELPESVTLKVQDTPSGRVLARALQIMRQRTDCTFGEALDEARDTRSRDEREFARQIADETIEALRNRLRTPHRYTPWQQTMIEDRIARLAAQDDPRGEADR